jgi:hypothetical protein
MGREREKYFIRPSKSSMVREHSLHKPSVIKSSGVSFPRMAMTTVSGHAKPPQNTQPHTLSGCRINSENKLKNPSISLTFCKMICTILNGYMNS